MTHRRKAHRRVDSIEELSDRLRRLRHVSDEAFDTYLPKKIRKLSFTHWTPLVVIRRVAEWVNALEIESVVDLGSGAGKVCVVLSLATECTCVGIERRGRLVDCARALASHFDVDSRVSFVEGALSEVEIPTARAYYLFNPFEENIALPFSRIDNHVEMSHAQYADDVSFTKGFLRSAPLGTYVFNYNGYGDFMPEEYEEIESDHELPQVLELWQKTREVIAIENC